MSRKNVLYIRNVYKNKPPRIGETIKHIYRNVTHLARDRHGGLVKEAYQLVTVWWPEDSISSLNKDIFIKLKYMIKDLDDQNYVVKYTNGKIIEYYDNVAHDQVELKEFNLDKFDQNNVKRPKTIYSQST